MMPVFSLLARLRWLRGTALDPFGYTTDSRLERQLISDYENLLDECLEHLQSGNLETIKALLALPEQIRGFGHVKQQHVDRANASKQALLAKLDVRLEVVRIVNPRAA